MAVFVVYCSILYIWNTVVIVVDMKAWVYKKGPVSIGINAFAMQVSWEYMYICLQLNSDLECVKVQYVKNSKR